MTLDAQVGVALGRLHVDVRLQAHPGHTVVLLGPNGAGKTTLLRSLAGLQPLDTGRITLDGDVLDEPAAGVWVPPERRSIGVVFQSYVLFPHLSALENVAFGLRARRFRRGDARRQAAVWMGRLGLTEHAETKPRELSGGQAQRVALARALAVEPRLLLLDEPLAALDATSRVELRRELRRHLASHAGIRIVVTHDPVEAMALADRVVVLENGCLSQAGTVAELRERPRSRYVADFVGVNLFRGRAARGRVTTLEGGELVVADPAHGEVFVVVHPRAVALHRREPEGTPRNVWPGTVVHLDHEGDRVRVVVEGRLPIAAEVTPGAASELDLREGARVWSSVKATEIAVYPA